MVTERTPFVLLVNEITYNDRLRLRSMLTEIGATLRGTSTPMSGPTEVMVDVIKADLKRVEQVFKNMNLPIIGVEEIPVE